MKRKRRWHRLEAYIGCVNYEEERLSASNQQVQEQGLTSVAVALDLCNS